jgi:hypothetical protein
LGRRRQRLGGAKRSYKGPELLRARPFVLPYSPNVVEEEFSGVPRRTGKF